MFMITKSKRYSIVPLTGWCRPWKLIPKKHLDQVSNQPERKKEKERTHNEHDVAKRGLFLVLSWVKERRDVQRETREAGSEAVPVLTFSDQRKGDSIGSNVSRPPTQCVLQSAASVLQRASVKFRVKIASYAFFLGPML